MPITNPQKVEEILTRRVDSIYPSKQALKKVLLSGKKLRLYLGIDPTAPNLHLGHTVPLRIIQAFADAGHEVILLFGTGTVMVGDPSERDTGRKLITQEEIEKNITTWKNQVRPIIDFDKVKIKSNGDWLNKLNFKDFIYLGSKISAIQLFKRENFTRRLKAGDTVWYHETMYPLLQGYDSVAMDVDLEVGGTDQTFNMLMGRELQRKINHKEKFVLTNKMIVGTDGQKMSKSIGNCIWLTDTPNDMYGKIMAIRDELISDYFEFFTNTPILEITKIRQKVRSSKINPMIYKKKLALKIVSDFHGKKAATNAQKQFEKVFQNRGVPSRIPTFSIKNLEKNPLDIITLLCVTDMLLSKSEAKRLLYQKAVKLNNKTINKSAALRIRPNDVIQVGKRKFIKFI